jgi:hypothetical protein
MVYYFDLKDRYDHHNIIMMGRNLVIYDQGLQSDLENKLYRKIEHHVDTSLVHSTKLKALVTENQAWACQ